MPAQKFTITLPEQASEQIEARTTPGLERGGGQRSQTFAKCLSRYFYLMAQARAGLRSQKLFSDQELGLLCDALNGSLYNEPRTVNYLPAEIADAIQLDNLSEKWEVDGPALIEKLNGLAQIELFALVDGIEMWWERQGRGGGGETPSYKEVLS